MGKNTTENKPIQDIFNQRWSPRAFSNEIPTEETLMALFETARWAPSSMNAQPWQFIRTAQNTPAYQKLLSTLKETNQLWAKTAPILVLTIMKNLRPSGQPDRFAPYDLGQAVAYFSIAATAQGLYTHQMGGFDATKAVELFQIPHGYQAMTVIAVGFLGSPDTLPDGLEERNPLERTRKPIDQVVFNDKWMLSSEG
jgi:nitroreductase